MSLENITVNGVPLKQFVAAELAVEIHQVKQTENRFKKASVAPARKIRNHSGARSGKCRILYSKGVIG